MLEKQVTTSNNARWSFHHQSAPATAIAKKDLLIQKQAERARRSSIINNAVNEIEMLRNKVCERSQQYGIIKSVINRYKVDLNYSFVTRGAICHRLRQLESIKVPPNFHKY
jgi:hypothetical protein